MMARSGGSRGADEVRGWVEVRVDRRAHRAAVRVAEDDEQAQALELVDGVLEAAEALAAQDVAGDAYDEDVVRLLTEDELEGHARVGAADHGREWDVVGRRVRGGVEADVLRPDRRHVPHRLPGRVAPERVGERLVPPLEERLRRRRGLGRRRRVRDRRVVAPDELEARRRVVAHALSSPSAR